MRDFFSNPPIGEAVSMPFSDSLLVQRLGQFTQNGTIHSVTAALPDASLQQER
jgi:hypothetical protein